MPTPFRNINRVAPAGHGAHHWLQQRLTAVINIIFLAIIFLCALFNQNMMEALKNPAIAAVAIIASLSIAKHMAFGMHVVIEAYVHHNSGKITLITANILFTIITAAVTIISILKIALT